MAGKKAAKSQIQATALSAHPAASVTFHPLNSPARLRNVRQMQVSQKLFEAYIRQSLVGVVVANGEVVRVTIYGAAEEFTVEIPVETGLADLNLASSGVQKYLITKE